MLNGKLAMMWLKRKRKSSLNHRYPKLNLLEQMEKFVAYLNSIQDQNLIDNNSELQIDRSHPIEKNINGFDFEYTQVKYPLLIYKFNGYEIVTEIKITEKQYAVGTQPMLYLCFPI